MSGGTEPIIIDNNQKEKSQKDNHPQENKKIPAQQAKQQKESMKDFQNQSSDYPKGRRQQVLDKMTKISPKDEMEFKKCQSWKEIYNFHKTYTPWLDDTQINEFILMYKAQAQTYHQKHGLSNDQIWRLNDL